MYILNNRVLYACYYYQSEQNIKMNNRASQPTIEKTSHTFLLTTYSSKYSAWLDIQNMATGNDRYSTICLK